MAARKPKAVAAVARPTGRQVPKEVEIKLTAQQKMQRTEQASRVNHEKTELQKTFEAEEKAWKQRRAEFKNQIKNLQDQVDKTLSEVECGTASSTENVTLVLNHDRGVAEYWFEFTDGWKMFEERPLEENERQGSLLQDKVDAMPESGQEVEE